MNKRWTTGKELMEFFDLTERELYEFFILGLPVYDGAGRFIINSMNPKTPRAIAGLGAVYVDTGSKHFIDMMGYKKFKIDEVRGFLEERGLTHLIPKPDQKCKPKHKTIPVLPGTKWFQIRFRIVSRTRIEITTPAGMEPYNPDDLGFTVDLWDLFERFAAEDAEYIASDKHSISRLRKLLRDIFPGINKAEDPLPFETKKGYRAEVHIAEA